jgi:hemolysin activation/secretion protein
LISASIRKTAARACGLGAAALLGGWPAAAWAQAVPPSAGARLQQAQPQITPPPVGATPLVDFVPPKSVQAPSSGTGATVPVKGFRLAGIDAEKAQALQPLLQKYVGETKTLADLEDAAKDIEVALQRQGLFLAQAYVPEQRLADGIVTLQVLEGRIGAVQLDVEPGVAVSAAFMDRIVAMLRGNPVAERGLIERALFTLGDLRGILVSSSLTPGTKVGQADLTIRIAAAPRVGYGLEADNGGSIFTGEYRVNAGVEWYSPAGLGDMLSLRTQFSTNGGTAFVRGAWLTPINALGTKLGLAASYLTYSLGSALFEPLDASGTAAALSVQLLHPAVRSRNSNLFLQASADRREFEDEVNAIALVSKKGITSYLTFGVVGDFRDTLGGGGISNYSANVVAGDLDIRTPADLAVDEAGYRSNGRYAKLLLAGTRLQVLPNKDYLYLSGSAQLSGKNLDSSEKFSLGGPYGVRAYPSGESPTDSGLLLGWEYRKPLRFESLPGDFVLAFFGDYGIGHLHQDPLPIDTGNLRRLMSHGIGMTYGNDTGLTLKGWVAVRGSTEAQSDDSRSRLYLQVSQPF